MLIIYKALPYSNKLTIAFGVHAVISKRSD